MPIVNTNSWIDWIKRDLKKIWVSEDFFVECLNLNTNLWIKNLDDIPKDKLKQIEDSVKEIFFHVLSLNTVVEDIWEEKIWDDFNFSINTCPKKAYKIAWSCRFSPKQVIDYVKDRQLYVRTLLDSRINKTPN